MSFPQEYPNLPPSLRVTSKIFHPNIYPDGRVCISVLHSPGDDALSGESANERWTPDRSLDSVLYSVVSMLGEPNVSSPANVDAAKVFRERPEDYCTIAKQCVQATLEF